MSALQIVSAGKLSELLGAVVEPERQKTEVCFKDYIHSNLT